MPRILNMLRLLTQSATKQKECTIKSLYNNSFPVIFIPINISSKFSSWPQVQPARTGRGDDLVCVVPADTKHVSVDEHSHMPMKSMLKYGAMGLLALLLPFLILKLFILPIKFMLGLKMMSLFNSLLLGTLLYSHHHHKPHEDSSYASSFPVASESQPLTGISGFGGGGFGTNKQADAAHGVEEVDEIDANSANSDYVDVLQPGDNIDRIFNLAKRQVRKRKLVRKRI